MILVRELLKIVRLQRGGGDAEDRTGDWSEGGAKMHRRLDADVFHFRAIDS